jgi:hypothetical protein
MECATSEIGMMLTRLTRRLMKPQRTPPAPIADVARAAISANDWESARLAIGNDADLAFHLGTDFLRDDPARGLFCRKLAASLAPDRLLYTLSVPWIAVECDSAIA